MFIILDIILVAIFALFVFMAMKKGFVLSLLEFLAVILSFVIAFSISPILAQTTYDVAMEEKLVDTVESKIDEKFSLDDTNEQAEVLLDSIPDYMVTFAGAFDISMEDVKDEIADERFTSEGVASQLVEKIAQPIAVGALSVLFFLIVAVILLFVLKILAKMIAKIFKLPIIKSVNKVLGGVLGAFKGLAVVFFICTILTVFFSSGDSEISEAVNDSLIIGAFEEINPLFESLKENF